MISFYSTIFIRLFYQIIVMTRCWNFSQMIWIRKDIGLIFSEESEINPVLSQLLFEQFSLFLFPYDYFDSGLRSKFQSCTIIVINQKFLSPFVTLKHHQSGFYLQIWEGFNQFFTVLFHLQIIEIVNISSDKIPIIRMFS